MVSSAELTKYQQTFDKSCPPFYRGAKCPNFWPKFRPRSSSDRRILEMRRFTGKQKQTCQGSIIGLPPYQSWGGWVPQLPEPLAQWIPQKVKVENVLYILHSSGPRRVQHHQCYTTCCACTCCEKTIHRHLTHAAPLFYTEGKMSQILAQISTPKDLGPRYF